jgi:photosystem II stability/assembly factor-like uncharacterized protein
MLEQRNLDERLRAFLARAAATPPPAGMNARIIGSGPRRNALAFQLMAAAAILVLAIGLGIVLQRARQSNAVLPAGVSPTATSLASPSVKPTPYPTPTASGAAYPLLPPSSMHMISASTGWAAGSTTNRILRTTDGGAHWVDVTPRTAKVGTWITFFLDANNAWLTSSLQPGSATPDFSVTIYKTIDGGRTWEQTGQVAPDQGWAASIDFVDRTHGWLFVNQGVAAGSQGVLFYGTVDGGRTWAKLSETDSSGNPGHLPFGCNKGLPVFLNSQTGWIPGACNAAGKPFFFVTHDGGRTWNDAGITLPEGYGGGCMCGPSSLRFADSRNGVFVLNLYGPDGLPHNFLYATHDAGGSWQAGAALPPNCYTAYFINASIGWTLDAKKNAILQTRDGGQHWSTAGTIPSNSNGVVMDFQFVTSQVGWALGADSRGLPILKTVDGGATWTTQLSP